MGFLAEYQHGLFDRDANKTMSRFIKVWRRNEFDAGGIGNDEQQLEVYDHEGKPRKFTRQYVENLRKAGWKGLDAIPEECIES